MRSLFVTALLLVGFEFILTSSTAAQLGGATGAITTWVADWLDPTKPLISKGVPVTTSASTQQASTQLLNSVPPATTPAVVTL